MPLEWAAMLKERSSLTQIPPPLVLVHVPYGLGHDWMIYLLRKDGKAGYIPHTHYNTLFIEARAWNLGEKNDLF